MTPAYDKKWQIYHYTAVKVAKMFVAFKFQISSFIQEIVRYQKKGGKLLLMLRKLIVSYLLTLILSYKIYKWCGRVFILNWASCRNGRSKNMFKRSCQRFLFLLEHHFTFTNWSRLSPKCNGLCLYSTNEFYEVILRQTNLYAEQ